MRNRTILVLFLFFIMTSLVIRTNAFAGPNFTPWAWGHNQIGSWDNHYGQLGPNAIPGQTATPVPVGGLTGIKAIAAGGNHSVAIKNDGTV